MPGQNDLGPFGPGVNPTTTEPSSFGDSNTGTYTWFNPCSSAEANDGTMFTAQWANRMMKYIRRACDGMGIARNEDDTDRLLKAIQKADKTPANVGGGVALFRRTNTVNNTHELRTLQAAGGLSVAVVSDGEGEPNIVRLLAKPSLPVRTITIAASGTYTPTAGTIAIRFRVQAAGGGSGGVDGQGASTQANANGGSGGGYAERLTLTPAASYAVTIGAPGAAGAAGANNGGNAAPTTVVGGDVNITCNGGLGGDGCTGTGTNLTSGGRPGGTATGGNINKPGGYAADVTIINWYPANAGNGGDSELGFGGRGLATGNGAGTSGTGFGSGAGGGSVRGSDSNFAGAAGQPGIVYADEFE